MRSIKGTLFHSFYLFHSNPFCIGKKFWSQSYGACTTNGDRFTILFHRFFLSIFFFGKNVSVHNLLIISIFFPWSYLGSFFIRFLLQSVIICNSLTYFKILHNLSAIQCKRLPSLAWKGSTISKIARPISLLSQLNCCETWHNLFTKLNEYSFSIEIHLAHALRRQNRALQMHFLSIRIWNIKTETRSPM